MELRKEYADIVEKASYQWSVAVNPAREVFEGIALACQELADRPPRELTASEKYELWLSVYDGMFGSTRCTNGSEVIDKIIAAFLEKQREPQVVKFRAARNGHSNTIELFRLADNGEPLNEYFKPAGWEWLEPAQEFEVRI